MAILRKSLVFRSQCLLIWPSVSEPLWMNSSRRIYCSDYKCSHWTGPFVNCFTYAERGLIYQAPGVQRALEVAEWMPF